MKFPQDGVLRLTDWRFKSDSAYIARGSRTTVNGHDILRVMFSGIGPGGTWRTDLLLEEGHYEFTGLARTKAVADSDDPPTGAMLRISGDTSTEGLTIAKDWTTLTYAFDVRGLENVELVCEFRGPQGLGEFDATSMRLTRKAPESKSPTKADRRDE